MYRIEICDGERGSALRLARMLHEITDQAVIQTVSEEQLSAELPAGMMRPDILFIGVQLKNGDGVLLAKRLKQVDPMIRVIFLAGKDDDVSDIFGAEPSGLLMRPFQKEKVRDAFSRAEGGLQELAQEYLQLKNREHLLRVPLADIFYIESDRRYLLVHQRNGVEQMRMKLSELQEQLPAYFVRCHQSYMVNLHMMEQMTDQNITLMDGTCIPISRSRKQETMEGVRNLDQENSHGRS